jgi:glycosyltransferase involved in cell wall biosynthesis
MNLVVLSRLSRNAGGLFYAVTSLCRSLAISKINVSVLGPEEPSQTSDLQFWPPANAIPYRAFGPLKTSFELRQLLKDSDPWLVHLHGLWRDEQWAALQWQNKKDKPIIISPHGMLDPWAVKNSSWKKKLVGSLFANESLHKATCIHALCQSEADSIRTYGLKNPIALIPNGIDLPPTSNTCAPPWDITKLDNKKILLYLGRIHSKKGLPNLINAWSKTIRNSSDAQDWSLGIVGWAQDKHEAELRKQVNSLDIQDSVLFLGPQFGDDKAACYQNASGFILPSFSEGLPMVVLEAWAYSLPVLMTSFCNIPEGFTASAAIKIQPEVKSIEQGLKDFFSLSDQERIQMGQNGLNLVKEKFAWDKIAKDMCSVYQWTLGGGTTPSCMETI